MNTTHTTSKPVPATYTVVGGPAGNPEGPSRGFSVILLNRGGSVCRADILEDFEKLDPDEIISIENPGNAWVIESLATRFPRVRFILLGRPVNTGECVNIGLEEAAGSLAAVFWNDMRVPPSGFSAAAFKALRENPVLCTTPWTFNQKNERLPTIQVPVFHKKKLKILPILPVKDLSPTLFPHDYCGIYAREKFLLLGGYNYRLKNSYWQKLDFGFRARLRGEQIVANSLFHIISSETTPVENAGADEDYRTFFLRNLAVRFTGDRGELPWAAFFPFSLHSRCGFFTALTEFLRAKGWVKQNARHFVMDSRSLMEQWEDPGE
jgi:hypothetical protein